MVYADDLACWSWEEGVLRGLMESFDRNLKEIGLEMNTEKTVIMRVGREDEREMEIVIDDERLRNVDQFVYLGGVFTSKGGCVREAVSYTHIRAHETPEHLVCRLLLEKKK